MAPAHDVFFTGSFCRGGGERRLSGGSIIIESAGREFVETETGGTRKRRYYKAGWDKVPKLLRIARPLFHETRRFFPLGTALGWDNLAREEGRDSSRDGWREAEEATTRDKKYRHVH
jgi:hypothetical protein